jgi:beta-phosphoglucomutase family hydrolase
MSSLIFKGAIFDLDGVITQTAAVHSTAWKTMFDEFLKRWYEKKNKPFAEFTNENDYIPYVDGKPRYKGVKSFLDSRGIDIPFGDKSDTPDKETVCGLGNKKNELYNEIVKRDGAFVFENSITLIREMLKKGIRVGVASSSKNTQLILQTSKIEDLFETRVDGVVSEELGLKGKPDPDIFIRAAANVGLLPNECLMVEDAISGVQAGRNGNFGLVLGVARHGDDEALKLNGADIVVKDLGDISLSEINDWFKEGVKKDAWKLTYHGYNPEEEKLRETLCTVGNGYFGTRGCLEGERASETNYPGTYIAGVYNKIPTTVHDKEIFNNDFVNCPNWTSIELKIGSGDFVSPLKMELLNYEQRLDMQNAVMERFITFKDSKGRTTTIKSKRIASMSDPHIGAIQYTVKPENYSEKIRLRSSIDGNLINSGVARYRQLNSLHLSPVAQGKTDSGTFLHTETTASKTQIIIGSKTQVYEGSSPLKIEKKIVEDKAHISEEVEIPMEEGKEYTLEKMVSIYTSLDLEIKNPEEAAKKALSSVNSFKEVFEPHKAAWADLWERADIIIDGDRLVQKITRLHIYHLLVAASPNNKTIDAGMTARGLHGEAYRGHIFWDELYILPFYNLHFPETSRALLMYRYKRLDAARKYAKDHGHDGAMYPWQTADDGSEETQIIHYNPVSEKWDPDLSSRQRHVSIAIFYNVWDYYQKTEDEEFITDYGFEMLIEIARFWASISTFDSDTEKYHIKGIMGPDEYHEKIPGAKDAGLTDNAYTNIMVVWLLEKALYAIKEFPQSTLDKISEKTGFKTSETKKWEDITHKMNIPISKTPIIDQFDGYMNLEELDWDHYRSKYKKIGRMDRILKSENDSPDKYKLSKQADLLMTFYVLQPEEIKRILNQLGYNFADSTKLLTENYDYYEGRTSHGSTLSKVVHASLAKDIDRNDAAWTWFIEALKSDLYDSQGGTTMEGIHCGVMAGTVMFIINKLAGVSFSENVPTVHPNLPAHWNRVSLKTLYKNCWYLFRVSKDDARVTAGKKGNGPPPFSN